jgi:hypothetical protein
LVFAFWYLASSSAFPSDLIFLWQLQAGIGRLWSSSSSSSACPVVDFVFGFPLRLSPSAFCFSFIVAFVFAFVWFRPSMGLLGHPHLVSFPSFLRSKSH